ncbi:insulinase family protein [Candidatus Poribacteria bacterium]|nr:insulinase family protein [Candidatus Poribacteria bacterium]
MSRTDARVHVYPNGLRLVVEERPDVRAAAFQIVVPAGSTTEPEELAGISRVLSEMCYRGAGSRDSRELSESLDGLGLQRSFGSSIDTCVFGGALLADDLPAALELHSDIVRRPRLPDDELEAVVAVALQELAAIEDSPARKMSVHLRRTYFLNEYGRNPSGTESGLTALHIEHVGKDHARRFQPDGAIIGAAGRLEWNAVRESVGELFGDWSGPSVAQPEPESREGAHYVHVEQDSAQEHIGVVYRSVAMSHPSAYHAAMATAVLSGGMGARLFTEVREKRGLAYAVSASGSAVRGAGYVVGYAGTTPERSQETLDVLIDQLRRIKDGVTDEELERARTGLLSDLIMHGESTTARARAIAGDMHLLGRPRSLGEIRAGVEAVSRESIRDFLADHAPSDFTIVTLGPRQLEPPQ